MSDVFREREQNGKTTIVDSADACRSSRDGRREMIESTETTERVDDDDQIRQKLLWAVKREVRAATENWLLQLNDRLGQTNDGGGGDEKVHTRRQLLCHHTLWYVHPRLADSIHRLGV